VITVGILGLVAAALLAEVGFRLFWVLPPDLAEFGHQGLYAATADGGVGLEPNCRGTLPMERGVPTTRVETNVLGMRGPQVGTKQPNERRVLVVGDSLVFGHGVEGDEALPARLQHELAAQGSPSTVGNGGIPGFGVSHSVARLAVLDAPFGADAFVVCTFLGNDAVDELRPLRRVYAGQLLRADVARLVPVSWRTRLAIRSRAALWLESWIAADRPTSSPFPDAPPDPEDAARLLGMPPRDQAEHGLFLDVIDESTSWAAGAPPAIPRVLATLRAALERAKEIAGERPLLFVVLPTSWQVDERKRVEMLRAMGCDPEQFARGLGQRRLLQVARDLGITALDATPILAAEADHAALFLADGGHLSVRGNAVVARWLAEEVVRGLK